MPGLPVPTRWKGDHGSSSTINRSVSQQLTRELTDESEMSASSKKLLVKKLGIKPGFRIRWVNPPDHWEAVLGELPPGVEVESDPAQDLDYIHVFALERQQLIEWMPQLRGQINQEGMIWASWPKQSSPMAGDLKENDVRRIGLDNNLVDIKVAAIDQDWSGLKFVIRVEDRDREG